MGVPLFRRRAMARSSRKRPSRARDRARKLGRAETPLARGGTEDAPRDYLWTRFAILFAVAADQGPRVQQQRPGDGEVGNGSRGSARLADGFEKSELREGCGSHWHH